MATDPLKAITGALDEAEHTGKVGIFRVKTANDTVLDAQKRPDPDPLYDELWFEEEVCCLFADSNLGKSIFAVQMAAYIAIRHRVLYIDCEMSDKQFQLRYSNPITGQRYEFPDTFFRAEIDPMAMVPKDYEKVILDHIEQTALAYSCDVVMVDNIGYLCNNMDKGSDAGSFMQNLKLLKFKHGWSLLIVAHTPKRSLSNPITQNDLGGSKRLFNFFDSVIAIGPSTQGKNIRYVKQVKVRHGAFKYDGDNVLVYEVKKENDFVHFEYLTTGRERDHLKDRSEDDEDMRVVNVREQMAKGKSSREIAAFLGIGKTKVAEIMKKIRAEQASAPGQNPGAPDTADTADNPDSNNLIPFEQD